MKYRVIAFTVAGVFTGFAGSLYAHFLTVITPFIFGLWQSIQIMIMSIVGGISSLVGGPMIGAILLYTLGDYLTRLQYFWYSALVIRRCGHAGAAFPAQGDRAGRPLGTILDQGGLERRRV